MSKNAKAGTAPGGLGRCTDCEAVYPVRRYAGDWHAIGTDGTCRCGGDEFTVMQPDSLGEKSSRSPTV